MRNSYYNLIVKIEKIHRMFLDQLKSELESLKLRDVSNIQASILYNIGTDEININTLMEREYYLGSNVSYNMRKLTENGYVVQKNDLYDRRQTVVNLSQKGMELYKHLDKIFMNHQDLLILTFMSEDNVREVWDKLVSIEGFFNKISNNIKIK